MNQPKDYYRRTGRTTRILKEAIEAAEGGQYVAIYCAHPMHRDVLMSEVTKLCKPKQIISHQKIYVGKGQITFELIEDGRLDLRNGIVKQAHPSVKVLADHYAIEAAMPWATRELYRCMESDHAP